MSSRAILPWCLTAVLVLPGAARSAWFTPSPVGFLPYGSSTTSLAPAWGDYDGDGNVDLPLYHNDGNGHFLQIPGFLGLLGGGNYHGAAWCDFDRDGDLDLSILSYVRTNPDSSLLLRNDGPDGFVDVAPVLGMNVSGKGETTVWGDFDADGWPDLFTPYYWHVPPHRSFLYRNLGNGTFSDITSAAGIVIDNTPEGAHAADYDYDGDLDLYCAAKLYQNDGTGVFTDVRAQVGLPHSLDEGCQFVDYDNDGDLDFYLRDVLGPRLFRQEGSGFTEVTAAAGLPQLAIFWGDSWADVDHDGDLDLYLAISDGPARLMLNQGGGTFAPDPLFSTLGITRSVSAWADYDRDGDLDLTVGDFGWYLYENRRDLQPNFAGSWIDVVALDVQGKRTQHGATIRLWRTDIPGPIQTRVVGGGAAYLAQSDYAAHFGVDPQGRYSVSVSFPSRPDHRVIADETTNPALGNIRPGSLPGGVLVVLREPQVVGVRDGPGSAGTARLAIPHPNPARDAVELRFLLPRPARVSLRILDVTGRMVRSLDLGELSAGPHVELWRRDRHSVRSGIYMVQMLVNGVAVDRKRIVVL